METVRGDSCDICGREGKRVVLKGKVLILCMRCRGILTKILEAGLESVSLRDLCSRVGLSRSEIKPYLDYLRKGSFLIEERKGVFSFVDVRRVN